MKTILVLGASHGQLPIIRAAKRMGLRVVCADRASDAVGMSECDLAVPVDFSLKDQILEIAKENGVDAVLTYQSDAAVPTVGFVNDQLGLAGVDYRTAICCSNKIEFRKKLQGSLCDQPEYSVSRSVDEALLAATRLGFPCVVKAPDSSGSRGVTKVISAKEVHAAFDEALKNTTLGQVIIEEFVDGFECGAQTFSIDGKCNTVILHNDWLSPPPFMVPLGHSMPFKCPAFMSEDVIRSEIAKAVESIGILNGPANVDLIIDSNSQRVKIIEIGARVGATCLHELVSTHTGVDWAIQTIKSALGEDPELKPHHLRSVAAEVITAPRDGVVKELALSEGLPDCAVDVSFDVKKGAQVSTFRKGTDRIGQVVCSGDDVYEAETNLKKVLSLVKIVIDD